MIMIGLSMVAAGLTMAKIFKNSHIIVLEENMTREIKLLSNTLEFPLTKNKDAVQFYTNEAQEIGKLIDSRVTFIEHDGTVIGDSEKDPLHMDNHSHRKEIAEASKDGVGHAIRYSSSIGQNMLYVATPVKVGNEFDGYIRLSVSLESIDNGLQQGWMLMAMWLIILFVIAGLISFRMATSLTLPLEKIIKVARRISQIDYDARVQLERHDEVGQLGNAINAMADSLQNQVKRIRDNEDLIQSVLDNMTSGILMIDVKGNIAVINPAAEEMLKVKSVHVLGKSFTEMKQHYELSKVFKEGISQRIPIHEERSLYYPEEKLMRIDGVPMLDEEGSYKGILFLLQDVSAIRRLENMRSEFVANVSHELKTPIAAVKGFAETLLGGGVTDEKTARAFLQIIYDESERLNRLISDILDLSKIESKRIPMDYSPVHLSSFFTSVLETMNTMADKKGISLERDIPDDLFVEADEDKLRQIFINLLSNAINYTQEGGRVKLTVRHLEHDNDEDRVQFTVMDTGLGIPKKDLPRIFERFYRVDKARSRGSGGTGLGLSIVKHLVDMHKGRLSVESELNIGSSFIVELPFIQDDE